VEQNVHGLIILKRLEKPRKNFCQSIRYPGQVSIQAPYEYKSEELLLEPAFGVPFLTKSVWESDLILTQSN
jgi:hypothetical protein